jgi:tRNA-splicing ligase RtcB
MSNDAFTGPLEALDAVSYRIPRGYRSDMRVDGIVFANAKLIAQIRADQALEQVANVATLPGIQVASLAMPDIHWGYGFCIGGVCATDPDEEGVISPGGVGYDINCGVRLIRTNLRFEEVKPHLVTLVSELFKRVPTGVGRSGRYRFDKKDLRKLMSLGSRFLIERDLGDSADIVHTESGGCIPMAEADRVSDRALARGEEQCGTLGSGNHFLEVQVVDQVWDAVVAEKFGLEQGQVCVMIHSGSRGLGYQVCSDALHMFRGVPERYKIRLPDRQLACAPIRSGEGQHYIGAMRAAANFAFCNRQLLTQQAREVFALVFGRSWQDLGMTLLYDVAHNIAKLEEHEINGQRKQVWVHRKGATRAFPAGHPEVPECYREVGQPVIIPGDMGRASWVLVGRPGSMRRSFGTTCHGAGRAMSRTAAVKATGKRRIDKELESQGIIARAQSLRGLAEEQPAAYKNVDDVVEVVHEADLSAKVARLRPIGVIKG